MLTGSQVHVKKTGWQTLLFSTLLLWLGGSLVLSLIVMPSLYTAGMMAEPGFVSAGYSLFWIFNRVELLAAGLVLTAILGMVINHISTHREHLILGLALLVITLVETYLLAPSMSAFGLSLDLFTVGQANPILMNQLQVGYWGLELVKWVSIGWLLQISDRG